MAQARPQGETRHPASLTVKCPDCHGSFPDHQSLDQHIGREFQRSNWVTHIHCVECLKYMPSYDALNSHLKRNHPRDQNLECPACGEHFVRVTQVARHIEQHECPQLDVAKLYSVHEKKMSFAKELQARHRGDYDEEVEAAYMSRNSALRPKADATVRPYPLQFAPFETDNVDAFWYHQNVIEARRNARLTNPAQPDKIAQAGDSSEPVPTTEANPRQSQLSAKMISTPASTEMWEQDITKAGATLLDDFDPAQNDKLQPSLVDYYRPGDEDGSGQQGPWSAYFNPWGNDDLIGLSLCSSSRAASPAPSPVVARVSTSGNQSPAEALSDKPLARPVVTMDDSGPTTIVPAALPAEVPSPTVPTGTSQSPTSLRPSQSPALSNAATATVTLFQDPLVTESAMMPQAVQSAKLSRAVGPDPLENISPLDDYDEVKQIIVNELALHDPRSPNFRVRDYYEPRIGKYKCPIPQCFKSFKKPGALEHHISTHITEKKIKYPCPGCKNMFDSTAALIAHTESQSIRCQFRHSKNYGTFLSQALAGLVDVVGMDPAHGTVQFAISKDAKKNLATSTPDQGDARRSRSDEFKAATAALQDRALDGDEGDLHMWEEHEREVEAQVAKQREEQRTMPVTQEKERQKLKERQGRELEQELFKEADQERIQKVWEAQKKRARQARSAQEHKIPHHKAQKTEQQRVRSGNNLQGHQVTHESDEYKVLNSSQPRVKQKNLEEQEDALLGEVERTGEQRWKLQEEEERQTLVRARPEMHNAEDSGPRRWSQDDIQGPYAGGGFRANW